MRQSFLASVCLLPWLLASSEQLDGVDEFGFDWEYIRGSKKDEPVPGPANVSLHCAGPDAVRLTWDYGEDWPRLAFSGGFFVQAPPFVPGGPGTLPAGPQPTFLVHTHRREYLFKHGIWDGENLRCFRNGVPDLAIDNDTVLHLDASLDYHDETSSAIFNMRSVNSNCVRLAAWGCQEVDCPARLPQPSDVSLECNGTDSFRISWRRDFPLDNLDGYILHLMTDPDDTSPVTLNVSAEATDFVFPRPPEMSLFYEPSEGDNPSFYAVLFSLPKAAAARNSYWLGPNPPSISLFECSPQFPLPGNFSLKCDGGELEVSWDPPPAEEADVLSGYQVSTMAISMPENSPPVTTGVMSPFWVPYDFWMKGRRVDPQRNAESGRYSMSLARQETEPPEQALRLLLAAVPKIGLDTRPSPVALVYVKPRAVCPPRPREVSVECSGADHVTVRWRPSLPTKRRVLGYRVLISLDPANETAEESPEVRRLFACCADRRSMTLCEGELEPGRRWRVQVAAVWGPGRDGPNEDGGIVDLADCQSPQARIQAGSDRDSPPDIAPSCILRLLN